MNWQEFQKTYYQRCGGLLNGPIFVAMLGRLDYKNLSAADLNDLEVNFFQRAANDEFSQYLDKTGAWALHLSLKASIM